MSVKMPDVCRCGTNTAIIHPGAGPHEASLRCQSCDRFRGWLSKSTADWIARIAKMFGAPDIITLRRRQ
jgi:hypothetical protein